MRKRSPCNGMAGPSAAVPPDPYESGLAKFSRDLRDGSITAEAVIRSCLERIDRLDSRLGAFEFVAADSAMAAAGALDRLLGSGIDLGPLMGVAVAIKDLIAVDGMPTRAGSNIDVSDLIGPEGTFVKALRRAGCIILGKTKTPEFAYGRGGVNTIRGTPWNPWSPREHRSPGGSSSGSAVAVAAGLCGFAVGTDTIGSIRVPAALSGVFGFKPTFGLWPIDGVFPLSPTLDTIGLLTRSAADAGFIFSALTGRPFPTPAPARGLRVGKPMHRFFESLDSDVEARVDAALQALVSAGANIVSVEIPETAELATDFSGFTAPELIASLGRERFLERRDDMDPLTAMRAAPGLEVMADRHIRRLRRHRQLCRLAQERFRGLDALVTPSVPIVAPRVADLLDQEIGPHLASELARNMGLGNLFGLCAASVPLAGNDLSSLPAGLQILCPAAADEKLLSVTLLVESMVGLPLYPPMDSFSAASNIGTEPRP